MKFIVVRRTALVTYFLSTWRDGGDCWDSLRSRALLLDASTARRTADALNRRSPASLTPVTVEGIR